MTDKASGSGALLGMSNFTDPSTGNARPPVIVNQAGVVIKVNPAWKRTN